MCLIMFITITIPKVLKKKKKKKEGGRGGGGGDMFLEKTASYHIYSINCPLDGTVGGRGAALHFKQRSIT